ncbi:MAG: choline/ethanolamine kinase family protein [Acidimicrobiia bacterium]
MISRVPGWSGRAHVVSALSGGITNRNHVVDVDGERFVVRVPGADTDELEIDRECEFVAASRAAELGIAPPVLGLFDGCLVTRFVAGAEIPADQFRTPGTLDRLATILRRFHGSGTLDHSFDAFTVPLLHHDAAARRGVPIPPAYSRVAETVDEISRAFAVSPDPPVPCHNDLLRANVLRDGSQLWLLDWEYAGMNDRAFDLANLAVNNDLSATAEEHLVGEYHGRVTARTLARMRLMKIVSDAREAMWGVVQQGISTIDFDYHAYAEEKFDRLLTNASAAEYSRMLRDAAEAPA